MLHYEGSTLIIDTEFNQKKNRYLINEKLFNDVDIKKTNDNYNKFAITISSMNNNLSEINKLNFHDKFLKTDLNQSIVCINI